jgi:GMP synthase (glutamine-hydrolysing)
MTIEQIEAEIEENPAADGSDEPGAGAPRRMLLIYHRPESQAGAVGQWLGANGYEFDVRCPAAGDSLPETLGAHAGAIIFGGPMSANDGDDYIRREIDWITVPLKEDKPFLGICLGAQMLAKTLGAEVGEHPDSVVEVGYYPLVPDETGPEALEWPQQVYQWHREGFTLPAGASRLASGAAFENQAIRYGENAYGVQFHPEMTLAMIHRWTIRAAHRLSAPGAHPRSEHIRAHNVHGPALRAWLDRFMRHWLGHGPRR